MPWSGWLVAIAFALTLVPYYGEYVAFLFVFAAAMIVGGATVRVSQEHQTLEHVIANALGINPGYVWPGFLVAIILAVGILFAVRAFRSNGERGLHAAILLLGFVFIVSVSAFRVAKGWPT
jgi:hypothetical protein